MPMSYHLACHTCQTRYDTGIYTRETVARMMGGLAIFKHTCHDLTIVCDAGLGFDDFIDNAYDKIMKYKLEAAPDANAIDSD